MKERRKYHRVVMRGWVSLQHPLLGTITAEVNDISAGGMSLRLEEDSNFFVMMELEARLHTGRSNEATPAMQVEVVRVQRRRVGLRFRDTGDRRGGLQVNPRSEESWARYGYEAQH